MPLYFDIVKLQRFHIFKYIFYISFGFFGVFNKRGRVGAAHTKLFQIFYGFMFLTSIIRLFEYGFRSFRMYNFYFL